MKTKIKNRTLLTSSICLVGSIILLLGMIVSVTQGAAQISTTEIINAIFNYDNTDSKQILVRMMRLPRVISAALVGSALSISGALMQGITRNPLADSGLMGLSAGAGLALSISFVFLTNISYSQTVLLTFIGAGVGAILIFGLSEMFPKGNQSMKLILAGVTMSALMSSISQGIAIIYQKSQSIAFWTMGSVSGSSWEEIKFATPFILLAIVFSHMISRQLSILSMGEDVAIGLGVKIKFVKVICIVLVVFLTGISFALAGMISFVGIIIPHLSRFLVGSDYKHIIPVSTVLGAVLLVYADIGAKTLAPPTELPIGSIIALIGVPVFLYFAHHQGGEYE